MDESSRCSGGVTSGLPLADGRVTLSDAPGTGFEASPVFEEVFSALIH